MQKRVFLLAAFAAWLVHQPGCAGWSAQPAEPELERRLYVAEDGRVSVYDIDEGHALVRTLRYPGADDFKGINVSLPLRRLYLSAHSSDQLYCIDLTTDELIWRRSYGRYIDSPAITPDGMTLYVPVRESKPWTWSVVDAATGDILDAIIIEKSPIDPRYGKRESPDSPRWTKSRGPHNTRLSHDGRHVYLEAITSPWIHIADTKTHEVVGRVGPFDPGVRPFTVNRDDTLAFANVDGLLGFSVGKVREGDRWGGPRLHRIEARPPAERVAQIGRREWRHHTPSHGVNLTPDERELWVVDGVYGYVYVYDATVLPPSRVATIPLFEDASEEPRPTWVSFSLDGRFAYPSSGQVIDTQTREIVARVAASEKLVEIDFLDGIPVAAGAR